MSELCGKSILIIEDESDVSQFFKMALEDAGYEVTVADNAEAAMKSIKANPPDLMTLDLIMPNQTGISLFKELRTSSEYKEIPIIVITGVDQDTKQAFSHKHLFKKLKIVHEPEAYLVKPVSSDTLTKTVEQVLKQETTAQKV